MKKFYLFLILLVAGILIGTTLFFYEWNRKPPRVADKAPDIVTTTDAVLKDFTSDTAAAGKKYTGKIVEMSGTVSSVEKAGNGDVSAIFQVDEATLSCKFSPRDNQGRIEEIKEKMPIKFKAQYNGFTEDIGLNVIFNLCVLEK